MRLVLRRARGILVMALLWAAPWAVIGAVYGVWRRARFPITAVIRDGVPGPGLGVLDTALWGAAVSAGWGLACGVAFALLIIAVEGRRPTSVGGAPAAWRASLWGALAALVGFGAAGAFALLPAVAAASTAVLSGAVLAGGLLSAARRPSAARLRAE